MLPRLLADMDIAVPVVSALRRQGADVLYAREEGWGNLSDSEILRRAHADLRFVLTHDSDFGELAVNRREAVTGIIYLRPGGRAPGDVIQDLEDLSQTDIDWSPPLIAVYRAGRLRLRRPPSGA